MFNTHTHPLLASQKKLGITVRVQGGAHCIGLLLHHRRDDRRVGRGMVNTSTIHTDSQAAWLSQPNYKSVELDWNQRPLPSF